MKPDADDWVVIGEVIGVFSVRGEVKVRPETDYPERFYKLDEVNLREPSGSLKTLRIRSVRFHRRMALMKLEGIDDRDLAQSLRGSLLIVPRSETVELPEDEFFVDDLVGIRVFTIGGRDLGEIREVARGPANDAYLTDEYAIPALKSVVREVDLVGRRMIVDAPEYELG